MKTISTFKSYELNKQEVNDCTGGTSYADLLIPATFPQNIQDRLSVIRDRYLSLVTNSIELEDQAATNPTAATQLQRVNTRINLMYSNYVRVVTNYLQTSGQL
jgi:hypothetical protein